MTSFVLDHRKRFGVERICKVLRVSPSSFHLDQARTRNPDLLPQRTKDDAALEIHIRRVYEESGQRYGVRKVWHQLRREGFTPPRCRVERLMRRHGLVGVSRSRKVRTTISDPTAPCPKDLVQRLFFADRPNRLWVSDFTYVSTWQGFAYVAFVTDVFACRIVGWKVSYSMRTDFVLDALEQALYARSPKEEDQLVHHSDRGVQYVSIRYTGRLSEAGLNPSVGTVGDSYDNALAETINGLYKAEVIYHKRKSWRNLEEVEWATAEWIEWYNNRRLMGTLGYTPPAQAEANYYAQIESEVIV